MSSKQELNINKKNSVENEKNDFLLNNIMKTWMEENNNINKNINNTKNNLPYEQIIDNTIIKKSDINYHNLPNWPSRSPFEFYNKNVIIPDNYKSSTINNNEKLNPINDNLNPFISNNGAEEKENKNFDNMKISIINPNLNKNENGNNNILIQDESIKNENENNIEKTKDNLGKDNNEENNNIKNDYSFIEKDIIYDFGYNKEERLEPIHLSLIRDTINDDEKNIDNFRYQIEKEKYEQSFKENNMQSKNKDKNKKGNNLYYNRNSEYLKRKNKILPKTEKEMEYFKEKDLFDEELNDDNFNITQKQMNILDKVSNNNYNFLREDLKKRNYELKHPYLEYEKYIQKEKISNLQSIDNHLTISQKNVIRRNRLKPILIKQKSIINNITYKKHNLNTHNSMNNIIPKPQNENNNPSLIFAYNKLNKKYNHPKNNILSYRSYSLKDYKNKYQNEKMDNFGGLGANLGGDEWQRRQNLLERKKDYSNYVLFNEKQNIEEKKLLKQHKGKLIKNIKMNDNNYNFPLIQNDKNYSIDQKDNKIYSKDFFQTRKYNINKENKEYKSNKILKNNSQLDFLYHNHNMYNLKYENIKSHIK